MLQRVIYHVAQLQGRATALTNTLPLDRVRLVFAALDDNRSVRAAARIAGCTRRTAGRYALMWRRANESGAAVDIGVNSLAVRPSPRALKGLREAADSRRMSAADLLTALLESVIEAKLVDAILDGAAVKRSHRHPASL